MNGLGNLRVPGGGGKSSKLEVVVLIPSYYETC